MLLQHITLTGAEGRQLSELQEVLPAVSRKALGRLLGELRAEARVVLRGERRLARWAIAPASLTQPAETLGQTGS